jgi:hypothetical protein
MIRSILLFCLLAFGEAASAQTAPAANAPKEGERLNGIYIPKDLDDCLLQFSSSWSDSMKTDFRKTPEANVLRRYYVIHEWIMDNWGLWKESRLAQYFHNFGMYHPEDMASMILISYHRQANEKELKLKDQIQHYRDYWKTQERSRPDITPEMMQPKEKKEEM